MLTPEQQRWIAEEEHRIAEIREVLERCRDLREAATDEALIEELEAV
jgi:hypothetical protein